MSIWDLLTTICFFMPVGGALTAAQQVRVGWGGYALAIAFGVLLGVLSAWLMRVVAEKAAARVEGRAVQRESGPQSTRTFFRGLYLAALAWIAIVGVVGQWASSLILRTIGP
jgi:hypothetical protein